MKIRLSFIWLCIIFIFKSNAQELNCNVRINPPQTVGTSVTLYENMQRDIYEFLNTRSWTNQKYESIERIECSILINIASASGSRYLATIQVISNRPIYATSIQTPILNYKEDDNQFEFEYIENQSLQFSESRHASNLTSVLAFYAYIIIGMDYDSFSLEGGTEFFQKALKISNNAQGSNDKGWRAFEARKQDNRYYLIENLTNSKYGAVRRASYRYHRLGLDVMTDKLESGKTEIGESLKYIQKVFRSNPNLFIIKVFFDAKSTELVNVFSSSFAAEKTKIHTILKEIDPAHISEYDKLLSSGTN